MATELYNRAQGVGKFAVSGMDLHHPPDLIPPDKAQLLLNVSPNLRSGSIQTRPGLISLGIVRGANVPIHSIRRINDNVPAATVPWARLIGVGTEVCMGTQNNFVVLYGGYSGNPLSIIPYRPPQSPETWAYVFDSAQIAFVKYKTDGTILRIGIQAPTVAPYVERTSPLYKFVIPSSPLGVWAVSGVMSGSANVARVATQIAAIQYDFLIAPFIRPNPPANLLIGWASIAVPPGPNEWMKPGAIVLLGGASEEVVIEEVFPALPLTTIAGVEYDTSAIPGFCTIQPASCTQGMTRGQLLLVAGEWTRVLSVTTGPDGTYSFRCFLSIHAVVGGNIQAFPSFRCNTYQTHAAGDTITGSSLAVTITGAGVGTVSQTNVVDLSQALSGAVIKALTNEDYMHVSLSINNPANVTEIHILLDVDSTTNNFTRNYYYYILRQGDFTQVATGDVTAVAGGLAAIQSDIIDLAATGEGEFGFAQQPGAGAATPEFKLTKPEQLTSGANQWFEATFKLNDLTKVGTDDSRTLADVQAVGVLVVAAGACTVNIASWWAGGGYGPDANFNSYGNQGQPIIYRYRWRSSVTGAMSDPSPATRAGEIPRRQGINLIIINSTDPQVDSVDIERNGGTFADWHKVLSLPNLFGDVYEDAVTEIAAMGNQALELQQYSPWPITDIPRSGTCNVTGTRIEWVSGDRFNTNWIRGMEIQINSTTYTLHGPPQTDIALDLEQNCGVFAGVPFLVPEGTITSYPLPFVWGPQDGRLFACGDVYNPGLLYFSHINNADSASDQGYIEVTSPSEPLINGFVFEGANYVFSNASLYRVEPTPGGANPYGAYKLGSTYGLAAPWAFTADAPVIFFLSTDGIYMYSPSGGAQNITSDDLYPLFPHESGGSTSVVILPDTPLLSITIYPPDYTQQAALRLSFSDNLLYFDFKDTTGAYVTFVYSLLAKGWMLYNYTPGGTEGAIIHYQERESPEQVTLVGSPDGTLYQVGGSVDNGIPIQCTVLTRADDQGDSRARKQYGDINLDFSGTVDSFSAYYDNYRTLGPIITPTPLLGRGQLIFDLTSDSQSLHRNLALLISWSSLDAVLYEWQPSFLMKPEDTKLRATDWDDDGDPANKFLQGAVLNIDTNDTPKVLRFETDFGQFQNFTVTHNGQGAVTMWFDTPLIGHAFRIVPQDGVSWRMFPYNGKPNGVRWIWEPHPELAARWITQTTSHQMSGFHHHRAAYIALQSTDFVVLSVNVDGAPVNYLIPSTVGEIRKIYIPLQPQKGKLSQYSVESCTPFRLWQKDCEVLVKQWNSSGPFLVQQPFGDLSFERGARV